MRANRIDLARVFWAAFQTAQRLEALGSPDVVENFLAVQRQYGVLRELVQEAEILVNIAKADAAIKRVLEGVQ